MSLAVLQAASASIYAGAGSPASIPAHIPPEFGRSAYEAIERIFPESWVESMLVRSALSSKNLSDAQAHLARMEPSVTRSELAARIALEQGDHSAAMNHFLDAVDVDAVQAEVDRLTKAGRIAKAYALENAVRTRLRSNATHPDAVAESYWRSGVLTTILGDLEVGLADYRHALALAPFSEKYLLAAGTQSLNLHQYKNARDYFERSISVDPASADAYAGMGVVALRQGHRASAERYERRSRTLDPNSQMLAALDRDLK
ncbi:MAG: hypothetical protein ABR584_06690 [Candidatus Baltobacteraceae bacterium]